MPEHQHAEARHEFDVRVTPEDALLALRRFLFRNCGWSTPFAVAFVIAYAIYDYYDGGLGWLGYFTIATVVLLLPARVGICHVTSPFATVPPLT